MHEVVRRFACYRAERRRYRSFKNVNGAKWLLPGLVRSALVAFFPNREGIAARIGPPVGLAIVIAVAVRLVAVAVVEAAEVAPGKAVQPPVVGSDAQLPLKAIDGKFDIADLTLGQPVQPLLKSASLLAQVLGFLAADQLAVAEDVDPKLDAAQAQVERGRLPVGITHLRRRRGFRFPSRGDGDHDCRRGGEQG